MIREFVILAITLSSFTASSQPSLGIKAGANFPNPTGSSTTSAIQGKTGFYAGALCVLPASTHFHFQPEVLWSSQGYKYEELGGEFKTTFNYIHLIAVLQYLSKGFFVETGPQLGSLVNVKRKGGINGTEDITDSFEKTAFSWVAGIGYRMNSGFGIDLRYTFGTGSISHDSNTDLKFNVLMLGLSKTFNISRKKK